ncbi:hypothetical protein JCM8208_005652, partial [Rhodotorula glutinis]
MASMTLFDDDLDFTAQAAPAAAPVAAPQNDTLVVASQVAAQDGSYQALVQELAAKGAKVEMQMVDRIVEGATTLPPATYKHAVILLPANLVAASLLALIEPALAPGGALEVRGEAASSDDLLGELTLLGLSGANKTDGAILAVKPTASSAPLSLKRPVSALEPPSTDGPAPSGEGVAAAMALPTRKSRAAKASLWAFTTAAASSGAATPTIDESTLLTDADLERPTLVKREDCDVKRTRKACKNCSCGLREILLDEKEDDDLVQAGFAAQPNATVDGASTATKAKPRKIKSGVT